ncbi:GNAT family N-acetyltransferase [Chitinolyticbacter albus]|uniref:GNAT family N-acetyltransferase n=1 Tax=Chitinolyticbacter albus TaxID=2961951 RepID=UPI0021097F6A|nr:GNAT family N-acetyltransferase [Chitinolyticbacter albus]
MTLAETDVRADSGETGEQFLAEQSSLHPELADWLVTPLLAQAWSDAIVDYWLIAQAAGRVDPRLPFAVFDLAGAGSPWLVPLLARVQARLQMLGRGDWQVVAAEPGCVSANPAVILALGVFGREAAGIYGVHYGRLMCGQHRWCDDGWQLDWHDGSPESDAGMVQCYLRQLNSAAFSIPHQVLRRIDALEQVAPAGYLLLALDPGVIALCDIRLGALAPPAQPGAAPVNFELLARYQRQRGARVHDRQDKVGGWTLHLAWQGAWAEDAVIDALFERLGAVLPTDGAGLVELAEQTAPSLALLRLGGHDPRLLARMLPRLIEAPPEGDEALRGAWREALCHVGRQLAGWCLEAGFAVEMAYVAAHFGDFALARALLLAALEADPDHPGAHYYLAELDALTGAMPDALARLRHLLAMQPELAAARELHDRLGETLARRAALPWWAADGLRDAELSLEPLGAEHAVALHYQYRDPQIGMMTRLPEFEAAAEFVAWLADQAADPARQGYAIVLDHAGAVGVISSHWRGDAGYLHFWLGPDWQGQGLAQRAVQLVLRSLPAGKAFYTSAYQDNYRSLQVLQRSGFVPLDCSAQEPDEDLRFYCYPHGDERSLACLLTGLDSPIQLDDAQMRSSEMATRTYAMT